MMEQFLLGVSRECITPAIGGQLYGYRPDLFSNALEDDLTATAFYFRQGSQEAVMVSITVCLINTDLARQLQEKIRDAVGISVDKILLSATHTHSGPNTAGAYGWGDIDRDYCDSILIPKVVNAVQAAKEKLQPVRMGMAQGQSLVGINRRQLFANNGIGLGQNPWGPFNPTMTVLSFQGEDGQIVGNLIHYGCHGTAAGANQEISRDWSGQMTDALEQETGGITSFFNGPEGDVGPRLSNGYTTGDITNVRELGKMAAADVLRIYRTMDGFRDAMLSAGTAEAKVPLKPRMPEAEAKEMLQQYLGNTVNIKGQIRHHLENVLAAWEKNLPQLSHYSFPQTVVGLGNCVFAAFPFELFSEVGMRIDGCFPEHQVLSLSNTNGSEGYFVTEDALCRGGYEVDMHLYGHVQTYGINADWELMKATVANIQKIIR